MKGVKTQVGNSHDNSIVRFNRDGKDIMIDFTFRTLRDPWTGETQIQVTIPQAEQIVFPDDLGPLLQCFGWGISRVGVNLLETRPGSYVHAGTWDRCCRIVCKVERCLGLY